MARMQPHLAGEMIRNRKGYTMFDKLEDLLLHYQELMGMLSEPDVANDSKRFGKLMKDINAAVTALTQEQIAELES